jgi:hypothetical protein
VRRTVATVWRLLRDRVPAFAGMTGLLLVAGCGGFPRPFQGNPGATAARLATPPPARLAVAPPGAAMLGDQDAGKFAAALADALVAVEVPAVADPPEKGDWRLAVQADRRGSSVVPVYTIDDPAGVQQGTTEGLPVATADWANAKPATLQQAAADAAPRLASLLTNIEAARHQSDPTSIANRPPRVAFLGVTGAPGDGNTSLARQMRTQLTNLGEVVQDTEKDADFVVACTVATAPVAGGQMRVEIQWTITNAKGQDLGKVVQLNDIPGGTLDHYWGDVALVVAQEAAGGVRDVILKQSGARSPSQSGAQPGVQPGAQPGKPPS